MEFIRIGKIINTHGIKGELKIQSYSDFDAQRYKSGNTVYIHYENTYLPFIVKTFRKHKGNSLVSFEEHQNINDVEKYKNSYIFITKKDRTPLAKGKFYRDELIGLTALSLDENPLGKVIAVEETKGAQNNLRIQLDDGKEFLVPYIPEFIKNVDIVQGTITIAMQEGLL